jgi:hypothetical protein
MIYDGHEVADTARVAREIAQALLEKRPLSLISMCDGESATLWAGKGFQTFNYLAGYGIPGAEFVPAAEQLAAAIARTDIVCVPQLHDGKANQYAAKLREALELWGIKLKPGALIGDAHVCWFLLFDMWLVGLLQGRRVLIVNNEADKVANALLTKTVPGQLKEWWVANWIQVTGADAIMLREGLAGSEQALREAEALPQKPDIALVGAGARAAHIVTSLAEMHSIPVIELGAACLNFHIPFATQAGYDQMLAMYRKEG